MARAVWEVEERTVSDLYQGQAVWHVLRRRVGAPEVLGTTWPSCEGPRRCLRAGCLWRGQGHVLTAGPG